MKIISTHRLAPIAFSLLAAGVPSAAVAQEGQGWYLSGSGTLSMLRSTEGTISNAPVPGSTVRTQNDFNTGWGAQAAVGYDFGRIRTEIELGFTRNKQDDYVAVVPPTGRIPADVKQDSLRGMLNAYFDIIDGPIQPYVGAGLGVTRVDLVFVGPRAPFPTEAPRELINDEDNRFAYQLIGGAAVALSPKLAVTAQYRWFDAGTIGGVDTRGEPITRHHRGHNLDLGMRLRF